MEESASKNQELFRLLEEVLPGNEREPLHFDNAKIICDAFGTADLESSRDLAMLEKACLWLSAFCLFLSDEIDEEKPNIILLNSLNVENDETWKESLKTLRIDMGNLRKKTNSFCKILKNNPSMICSDVKIQNEHYKYLQNYIERAKLMLEDKAVDDFCKEIIDSMKRYFCAPGSEIYSSTFLESSDENRTGNQYLPFWIVCASSGTGKSQFAYTLSVPLIYLLMEKGEISAEQALNKPFKNISDKFREIYEEECKQYLQKFTSAELGIEGLKAAKDAVNSEYKFCTLGFIVTLLRIMVELRKTQNEIHWLELQWNITKFKYLALSINEAIEELHSIRSCMLEGDRNLPFCFFLDECKIDDEKRNHFRFIRNLMRAVKICFIAAGTNAGSCNFADEVSAGRSRDTPGVWCHLIFRLPKVANTVLSKVKEDSKALCRDYCIKKGYGESKCKSIENLLDSVLDTFQWDRPLFLHYAFAKISELFKSDLDFSSDDFFWDILDYIFITFTTAKNSATPNNTNGQFAMITAMYWKGLPLDKSGSSSEDQPKNDEVIVFRSDIIFCKPTLVHEHLALVGVPSIILRGGNNILDFYVKMTETAIPNSASSTEDSASSTEDSVPIAQDSAPKFKKEMSLYCKLPPTDNPRSKRQQYFHHYSRYSNFNQEPIAGLAFTPACGSFPENSSVMNAMYDIMTRPDFVGYLYRHEAYNGHLLELATTTACIISSHWNRFAGINFIEWLPRFFDELRFCFPSDPRRSILVDSDEFCGNWNNIHIPYLTPQVSVKFDETLISQFRNWNANVKVGEMRANVSSFEKSRDFSIRSSEEVLINGECKLWENAVNFTILNNILVKFNNLADSSKMHIVVAIRFSEFEKFDFPENFTIYKAVRESSETSNVSKYSIKRVFPLENSGYTIEMDDVEDDNRNDSQSRQETLGAEGKAVDPSEKMRSIPAREIFNDKQHQMQPSSSTIRNTRENLLENESTAKKQKDEKKCVILIGLEDIAFKGDKFNENIDKFK